VIGSYDVMCDVIGYEIDVYRDTDNIEDDVAIGEFSDVLEEWIINALKAIGCDTAKSVLALPSKDLVLRTDLEKETVEEVLNILNAEFED
jgi:N utilization substance protein A